MAVSLLGDGIFIVAVAWQAYAISDHPSALAYVGVATSVPQLVFLLVGGAVSDRLSRRTVLFWADIVRALAVGALAVVVAGRSARLYELCLAGAVIGTATAFASPSFDALVPSSSSPAPSPSSWPARRWAAWPSPSCAHGGLSPWTPPASSSLPCA